MNSIDYQNKIESIIGLNFLNNIIPDRILDKLDNDIKINKLISLNIKYKKELDLRELNDADPNLKDFFGQLLNFRNYILLPRVININSSNVFGFSLDYLRHLFIDKYLEQRFIFDRCLFGLSEGESDLIDLKFKFVSSLRQAIEYLNNSIKADLSISPVLLYYSLINFINCYNLLKYKEVQSDKENRHHGLKVDINRSDLFLSKIVIGNTGNMMPYLKINSLKVQNNEYQLIDALKSVYFMSPILERLNYSSNIIFIQDQNNDKILTTPWGNYKSRISIDIEKFSKISGTTITNDNIEILLDYFLPKFQNLLALKVIKIYSSFIHENTDGTRMAVIDCAPNNYYEKEIIEFLATHRDQNGNRFFIIDNKTKVNDPIFHIYTSLHAFCELSRYHPDVWSNFIAKDQSRIIMSHFINSGAIFILYNFLTLLTNEFISFK